MIISYKKMTELLAEHESVSIQIRAHRVIALRKRHLLCNSSILALAGKKEVHIVDKVDLIGKQLDKFNTLMETIEKEISKVFYVKAILDELLDDAECQEEEISDALTEVLLSIN